MVKLVISENEAGQRLDRFLKKYMRKAPLSVIYKIIRKDAKLNGKRASENSMLQCGDELTLYISDEDFKKFTAVVKKKPAKRQFKIAYEDDNILIVDKPWGLLTHGDSREKKNTLANQVCGYLQDKREYNPEKEKTFVPSPVNRLDRNTTGLVIFGKSSEVLREFTRYIREREYIKKYYITVASGVVEKSFSISNRLIKDEKSNISSVLNENTKDRELYKGADRPGKNAKTYVTPIVSKDGYTLLEIELVTGRTHQIRSHLSYKGFPLIGDAKYGDKSVNRQMKDRLGISTQLLHAYRLEFSDMEGRFKYLNGKRVTAKIPQEFSRVLEILGFDIDDLEAQGR